MFQQVALGIDLEIEPSWGYWFSGFVDGEGYFGTQLKKNKSGNGLGVSPRFAILLRDDDAEIIMDARNRLHCGILSYRSFNKGVNPQINWVVVAIGECRHILVPFFDQFPLRAKKKYDYEIWRKIVIAVWDDQHLKGNRAQVLEWVEQLRAVKRYSSRTSNNPGDAGDES